MSIAPILPSNDFLIEMPTGAKQPELNKALISMKNHSNSIIKVIGVGGGGNNAVANMYREQIEGVRLMVCNTDQKALEDSPVTDRLQLGPGLGAGGNPDLARQYAEENIDKIHRALDDGTKMVFVTTGMGGGTGTGVAPIIAREAKARGILTIGIVTIPFLFEMRPRIDKALDGVETMKKYVDALLVVNNERLRQLYNEFTLRNAFRCADDSLTRAVRSIVEIINMRGKINLDFRDVDTVLRDGGVAIMSYGIASGEHRIKKAIQSALDSPLLNDNDVFNSRKILMCIHAAPDEKGYPLRMDELGEIDEFMRGFHMDIGTKYGIAYDDALTDEVRVTILASGFKLQYEDDIPFSLTDGQGNNINEMRKREERRNTYYAKCEGNKTTIAKRRQRHIYIYDVEHIDDENVVALVDVKPTSQRSFHDLENIEQSGKA